MKLQKTAVYDSYWYLAYERQNIFYKRLIDHGQPYTVDPILDQYSFTNAYRASDRVSQYLIRDVIYASDMSAGDTIFRILFFKLFNSIETWKLVESHLGPISWSDYSYEAYCKVLDGAITSGKVIYSSAYIMPSGKSYFGKQRKHQNNLLLLEHMMHDNIVDKIISTKSLQQLYILLLSYPTIGPFLAYQYAIDINYSDCIDFGESDFTQPGPGALGGISKCFSNVPKGREKEVIEYMHDIQQNAFESQGLEFKTLWGRSLQYIDIQNLFCEVDKYARVKHPDIKGNSDRTRIKRKFKPSQDPIEYFYPPKWGINAKLNDITQHNLSYQTT